MLKEAIEVEQTRIIIDDIIAIVSKWGEKYTYRWDEVDSMVDYIYEEFEILAGHSTKRK